MHKMIFYFQETELTQELSFELNSDITFEKNVIFESEKNAITENRWDLKGTKNADFLNKFSEELIIMLKNYELDYIEMNIDDENIICIKKNEIYRITYNVFTTIDTDQDQTKYQLSLLLN